MGISWWIPVWGYSATYTPMIISGSLHIHTSEPKECVTSSKLKIQSTQMEINNSMENE